MLLDMYAHKHIAKKNKKHNSNKTAKHTFLTHIYRPTQTHPTTATTQMQGLRYVQLLYTIVQ